MSIVREVLEALGQEELLRLRDRIDSKTLRNGLRLIVEVSRRRARLFIPHYWAVYYHDGHGPIQPRNAKVLVFFADPKDDPRLRGKRAERASQERRLTKAQYQRGLEENRRRRARGAEPFMYVVPSTGARDGDPFFDKNARGIVPRADRIVERVVDDHVQRLIDTDKVLGPDIGVIDVRLPRR